MKEIKVLNAVMEPGFIDGQNGYHCTPCRGAALAERTTCTEKGCSEYVVSHRRKRAIRISRFAVVRIPFPPCGTLNPIGAQPVRCLPVEFYKDQRTMETNDELHATDRTDTRTSIRNTSGRGSSNGAIARR